MAAIGLGESPLYPGTGIDARHPAAAQISAKGTPLCAAREVAVVITTSGNKVTTRGNKVTTRGNKVTTRGNKVTAA